jgi:AGZA family xanthine/uracil permease-like MFS transporter
MVEPLERFFGLRAAGTTVRTEVVAGATTFAALSYIIFVQPAVLSAAGMDAGAVMVATCLAAALATLLLGLLANYPIAAAPAMGHNFFFAFTVVVGMGVPWPVALGADFLAGVLFIALAAFRFRERVMDAVPPPLRAAIPAGIGLLIAMVGMQWAGIVVADPGSMVKLGDLTAPPTLLALGGFLLIAALAARGVRAAILAGMLVTAAAGLVLGLLPWHGLVAMPPSLAPTFLRLDVTGALRLDMIEVVFVFVFLAVFDTVGTLLGVAAKGGFLVEGRLPRAGRALLADAVGTTAGTLLGTSTVTAYVESAAGVSAGGRTGLANVVTAALLVLAVFLAPVAELVGGSVTVDGAVLRPVTATALLSVGWLMLGSLTAVAWDDATEAVPAFLAVVTMPLALSIADGLAFGFISYAVLKLVAGRAREAHPLVWVFTALFLVRFILT